MNREILKLQKDQREHSLQYRLSSLRFCSMLILLGLAPSSDSGASLVSASLPHHSSVRALIATFPTPLAQKVRAGTNRVDLAPYINRAIAQGGTFDLGGFTYLIAGRLDPGTGTHLTGKGIVLASPAFDDSVRRDGLHMMIRIVDGLQIENGVVFDGNSITRSNFWLTGARNTGPVRNVIIDGVFRNLSFDGLDISRSGGAWRNSNIVTRATIENVGWIGANLEGIDGLVHDGLQVSRTGFHGIYVGHGRQVRGDGFRVDKSRPPYRIYDGPGGFGGQEKGFLFGHFSTIGARWTHFRLFDNRHAGYDGFGIGEDGPLADPESRDIFAQGEIWYAGLFGFDVSTDMRAEIAVHHPKRQGIQFGLDLGGTLSNIRVRALVEGNIEDEAARFSATGSAVRKVIMQAGSPEIVLTGGGDFTVVPGQFANGAGIWPGTRVVEAAGEKILLDRPVFATYSKARPATVIFRAHILFTDCLLDIKVAGSRYGLGVQSDADGFTHYNNVRVTGDLSSASQSAIRQLNGTIPTGVAITAKLRSRR